MWEKVKSKMWDLLISGKKQSQLQWDLNKTPLGQFLFWAHRHRTFSARNARQRACVGSCARRQLVMRGGRCRAWDTLSYLQCLQIESGMQMISQDNLPVAYIVHVLATCGWGRNTNTGNPEERTTAQPTRSLWSSHQNISVSMHRRMRDCVRSVSNWAGAGLL